MTPNLEPEEDEVLLGRMRAGDEGAFVALYRRRQAAIYRCASHMTSSSSAAEDITQEVFLALIRKDCGFDPLRGSLSAYLFGIARKLVLRHLERNRLVGDISGDGLEAASPTVADPINDLMRLEGISQLRRAVHALPKRYREVVVLCDLEELDYVAAAAALDCPVGTVRSRLHRARALLLEKMQKHDGTQPIRGLNPVRTLI
jgi:RNA polymerase sigma-70 factor (ECF subfamily)